MRDVGRADNDALGRGEEPERAARNPGEERPTAPVLRRVFKRIFGQDVAKETENPPTLVRPPCIRSSAPANRLRPTVFAGGVPSATMIVIDARRASSLPVEGRPIAFRIARVVSGDKPTRPPTRMHTHTKGTRDTGRLLGRKKKQKQTSCVRSTRRRRRLSWTAVRPPQSDPVGFLRGGGCRAPLAFDPFPGPLGRPATPTRVRVFSDKSDLRPAADTPIVER